MSKTSEHHSSRLRKTVIQWCTFLLKPHTCLTNPIPSKPWLATYRNPPNRFTSAPAEASLSPSEPLQTSGARTLLRPLKSPKGVLVPWRAGPRKYSRKKINKPTQPSCNILHLWDLDYPVHHLDFGHLALKRRNAIFLEDIKSSPGLNDLFNMVNANSWHLHDAFHVPGIAVAGVGWVGMTKETRGMLLSVGSMINVEYCIRAAQVQDPALHTPPELRAMPS